MEKHKEAITKAAKQTIGDKQRGWFDQQCRSAIRDKNEARLTMLGRNTRRTQNIYKEKIRIAKEICRHKKKEALNIKLKNISDLYGMRNVRGMYERVRRERMGYQPRLANVKDEHGKMLSEEKEIKDRWARYYAKVFNQGNEDTEVRPRANIWLDEKETNDYEEAGDGHLDEVIDSPSREKFIEALRRMKNGKAP